MGFNWHQWLPNTDIPSLTKQSGRLLPALPAFPKGGGAGNRHNCVTKLLTFQRYIGSQASVLRAYLLISNLILPCDASLRYPMHAGDAYFPFYRTMWHTRWWSNSTNPQSSSYWWTISTSQKEFSPVWKCEHFGTAFLMCWQQALTFDCTFCKVKK